MKLRHISTIALLLALSFNSFGQSKMLESYRELCDTLSTLLRMETGVKNVQELKSVMKRGNLLDFYFNDNLGDVPWTQAREKWFAKQIASLSAPEYRKYQVGEIYCGRLPLKELYTPVLNGGGKPAGSKYKINQPKCEAQIVERIGDLDFDKGLTGRHIALWQSHGRYFEAERNQWQWQRAQLFTTVEDMFTQSFVLPFLIPMLENAGAYVMTPRERDTQTWEIVADNDPAFTDAREGRTRLQGKYEETGAWKDAGTGFADAKMIYTGTDNPFTMGTVRQASCSKDGSKYASATWSADIPERGEYAVYISYSTLSNSTSAAHYTVRHLGGTTEFSVNQKMGGGTWIYLGTFEFDGTGEVTLDNMTPEGKTYVSGKVITADAVHFGGGMGKVARGLADQPVEEYTLSGMPSYAEGAIYSMQWAGVDSTILRAHDDDYTNDFADRGAWVKLMSGGSDINPKEKGKGIPIDLSFAFHTDAGFTPNDSIIGTLGIYTLLCDKSRKFPNGSDRMANREYVDMIQSQVVSDIQTKYEPEWRRRQLWNRSYSESRTPGTPGMILELLSHQNFADMKYGLDPSFRFDVSRAVYKGILKFLSNRYGCHYAVQPLPICSFATKLSAEMGYVELSWKATTDSLEATATPDGFILYTRIDDGCFDAGKVIRNARRNGDRYLYKLAIEPGHIYSFKVEAYNAGGKSFPSEILSAGVPKGASKDSTVLIVNNFTRVSGPAWFDTPTYAGFDDRLDAGVPYIRGIERIGSMYQNIRSAEWKSDDYPGFGATFSDEACGIVPGNIFDFTYIHGTSVLRAGYAFCSSSSEAFAADKSISGTAWACDMICGKQVTTPVGPGGRVKDKFPVFPAALRQRISEYCSDGGNILVSGANIGTDIWDMVYQSVTIDSADRAQSKEFAQNVLGYKSVGNYASKHGTVRIDRAANFKGIDTQIGFHQEKNAYIYNVETPDGLMPGGDKSSTVLRYTDTNIGAGVCFDGNGYRTFCMGFPIETIKDAADRDKLFKAVFQYFSKANSE